MNEPIFLSSHLYIASRIHNQYNFLTRIVIDMFMEILVLTVAFSSQIVHPKGKR